MKLKERKTFCTEYFFGQAFVIIDRTPMDGHGRTGT